MVGSKSESCIQRTSMRLSVCVLLSIWALAMAAGAVFADTLTLQQGLNGYSGGTDTFIGNGTYPENAGQNYGSCSEIRAWCGHYASY
jgi:hypothetical protein